MRLFPEPRFKSEYEIATTLLKVAEEETKKRITRETGGESALAPAERGNYCFVVGGHSDPHHLASVGVVTMDIDEHVMNKYEVIYKLASAYKLHRLVRTQSPVQKAAEH